MLATVGLFGVLSQAVQQRMREFGVRIALGATPRNVIGLVVRHARTSRTIGMVAGLALAVMLGRLLAALIFPIAPSGSDHLRSRTARRTAHRRGGCVAPAWHAMRVDPATAFREE